MKIAAIELENWLNHAHIKVQLTPMTLITGPNGRGKSAIADAVAFAMTGELRRVDARGERKRLLTEGAAKGKVVLHLPTGALERDVATGKIRQGAALGEGTFDALPALLDPRLFARLDSDNRRIMLQAVLKAEPTKDVVGKKLEERGIRADVLAKLRAVTVPDYEAWVVEALDQAANSRASWRSTTGEQYGAVKAATWVAAGPTEAADEAALPQRSAAVAQAQQEVDAAQQRVGAARAAAEMQSVLGTVDGLKEMAASLPVLQLDTDMLRKAESEAHDKHAQYRDEVTRLRMHASNELSCPHCGCSVTLDGDGNLQPMSAVTSRPTAADVEAAVARLDALDQALVTATAARRGNERAIADAQHAQERLRAVADMQAKAGALLGDDREAAASALRDAQAKLTTATAALHALEQSITAARAAADKTTKARNLHELMEAWTKVSALLAPSGIPAELLTAAMEPLTEELRTIATETGWRQVTVAADMTISAGGRAHELLSESEQWRADASFAVALAKLSGLRIVALDRFDLLEVAARQPAMAWLYKRTQAGALETCLLIATMKEKPSAPKAVQVIWLGDTVAGSAAQRAA